MTTPVSLPPEFSRPVPADRLPRLGRTHLIEASAEERAALAKRFGLESLDSLTAKITLTPFAGGDMARVEGRFEASCVQRCGVTLEKLPVQVAESFHLTYSLVPVEPASPSEQDIELDVEAEDPPEPTEDGQVDIGEAVAEQLALAIDPFPRAPGAEFVPPADGDNTPPFGPFAVLAGLKDKKS